LVKTDDSAVGFYALNGKRFEQITERISFAKKWCQKFLSFQRFP